MGAKKVANICATLYEGDFEVNYDCVGETVCKFAMCEIMPPTGENPCAFKEHGSCRSPQAKLAAIDLLGKKLSKESKQIREGFED